MKKSLLLFLILIQTGLFAQSPCNTNTSICAPGVAGPFGFGLGNGAGTDFANGTCATGTGVSPNFGFIVLNINLSGTLNMLIDANTNGGFIDVIVFNVPAGEDPCVAVMDPANEIGCNFATNQGGCVQLGTTFPCNSSVPAPNVTAGDQLMVIVHDWSDENTDFTLELDDAPGSAQAGPPTASISIPPTVSEVDPAFPATTISAGGTWSASCGACIDPSTGVFDPAIAGPGNYEVYYQIGVAPCDATDTAFITVTPDCIIPFTAVSTPAYEDCQPGVYDITLDYTDGDGHVVYFNLLGSASSGSDYSPIIDSIVFPVGVATGSITIDALEDFVSDDDEIIIFEFYNPCTGDIYFIDTLDVLELGLLSLSVSNDTVCPADLINLTGDLANIDPMNVVYLWSSPSASIANPNQANTTATLDDSDFIFLEASFGTCTKLDTTFILVDSFEIDLDITEITCPGTDDGALAIIPTGGVGNLSYSWSPTVSTDSFLNNLGPNTYTVTVTDESGLSCGTITESYQLVEPVGLTFTFDTTNVTCFGLDNGSITINGLSPSMNYNADIEFNMLPQASQTFTSDGTGAFTFNNLLPGSYSPILITDPSTGCSNTFNVLIEEPDTLTVTITAPGNVLCAGGTIDSLTATTSGGTGPHVYNWNTGESTPTIQNIVFGTYWVEDTDANGCYATDTIIIAQPNPIGFTLLSDSISCFGGNNGLAYIDTIGGGTPPFTFLWDAAAANQITDTAFSLIAGSYILTVTDFNGCQEQDTVTVDQALEINLTETHVDLVCFEENTGSNDVTVTNGVLPFNYSWTGPNGFIASTEDLSNLFSGVYDLIFSDNSGCMDTLSVTINQPTDIQLTIDSTDVTCKNLANGTATVTAIGGTGAFTYNWSHDPGLNAAIATNLTPNNYQVIVNDANLCLDTITTSISEPDSLLLSLDSVINVTCNGDNTGGIQVSTTGGTLAYTYLWTNGGGANEDLTAALAGTYTLSVSDNNGCTDTITEIVPEPAALDITLDEVDIDCFGASNGSIDATISGGLTPYNFNWTGPNGYTANTEDISGLEPGLYTLNLIDSNSCILSESISIDEPTAIQLTIDSTDVTCKDLANGTATVTPIGGTGAYTYSWSHDPALTTANASSLAPNTYQVIVSDANSCLDTITTTISEPDSLLLSIDNIINVLCNDSSTGEIQVSTIGGTLPYTYLWTNGGGSNEDLTAANAGIYSLSVNDINGCSDTFTATITEPNAIGISLIGSNLDCFEANDGSIDATITGGVTPYLFDWTGPNGFSASTEDISGLEAGLYLLTVTDANACNLSDSITITQPTAIELTIDSTDVTCKNLANGSATVTAIGGTGAYTYSWSHDAALTITTANNLTPNTYQVIVSDANSCLDTITTTISEPDSLLLATNNIVNVLCNGNSTGEIQVNTSGGTPNYTYSWSNGGGSNEDLTNALAGTYTLTIVDVNGCSNTLTETITEPTPLNIVLVGTNSNCFNADNGSIDATSSGGVTPYTFSWSDQNGFTAITEDISALQPGTYTLTTTDANNCSTNESLTITQPANLTVDFSSQSVNCFGGNDGTLTVSILSGGTAPFTYQWDAATNNQTTTTASGLIEGSYEVTMTDLNLCTYSFTSTVTQPAAPLSLSIDSSLITCQGANDGTATVFPVGGTEPFTYLWNDALGQTTATANNLAPNTYQVSVLDLNNCLETITVLITEPDEIVPSALVDSANCWGDATGSITLSAIGGTGLGYTYSIDGGVTFEENPLFTNLEAGIYDGILIQDIGSPDLCLSNLFTTTLFEPDYFIVRINPLDTTLELEESVELGLAIETPYTLADVAQISWSPTIGLNCSDCLNPIVLSYENFTEYTASLSYFGDDNELCSVSTSSVIYVENNLELFIPNAFTPGNFDDMNNVFEIYGEGIEFTKMQIYNRWGEKIFESANQRVAWDGTFKGQIQNPGVYTYYVEVQYLDGKDLQKKGSVTLLR